MSPAAASVVLAACVVASSATTTTLAVTVTTTTSSTVTASVVGSGSQTGAVLSRPAIQTPAAGTLKKVTWTGGVLNGKTTFEPNDVCSASFASGSNTVENYVKSYCYQQAAGPPVTYALVTELFTATDFDCSGAMVSRHPTLTLPLVAGDLSIDCLADVAPGSIQMFTYTTQAACALDPSSASALSALCNMETVSWGKCNDFTQKVGTHLSSKYEKDGKLKFWRKNLCDHAADRADTTGATCPTTPTANACNDGTTEGYTLFRVVVPTTLAPTPPPTPAPTAEDLSANQATATNTTNTTTAMPGATTVGTGVASGTVSMAVCSIAHLCGLLLCTVFA